MVTKFVPYSVHELCIVSVGVLQILDLSWSHNLCLTVYMSCALLVLV